MSRTLGLMLVLALATPAAAQDAAAPAPAPAPAPTPAPAWKPFQEFAFLIGSFSGTADSSGRIGGTVTRFSMEMNGNFLVHRVNTIFPAQDGKPEESIELLGTYHYDRDARKYFATYYFSTGLVGEFDVEFLADGTLRLTSSRLANYDPGARARIVVTRKTDGSHELALDLAMQGKDFVPYFTSHLTKK